MACSLAKKGYKYLINKNIITIKPADTKVQKIISVSCQYYVHATLISIDVCLVSGLFGLDACAGAWLCNEPLILATGMSCALIVFRWLYPIACIAVCYRLYVKYRNNQLNLWEF